MRVANASVGRKPRDADDRLSLDEMHAAGTGLTAEERLRLRRHARTYAMGTEYEPDDLLQEALARALTEGTGRTCPRDVPVVVFLCNAMRSIGHASRRHLAGLPAVDTLDGTDDDDAPIQIADPGRTVEEALVAKADFNDAVQALERLFENDGEALFVVMGDMDEVPAAEMKAILGLNDVKFASVRRRIQRHIAGAFPKGWIP